jgi:hypothetical protein
MDYVGDCDGFYHNEAETCILCAIYSSGAEHVCKVRHMAYLSSFAENVRSMSSSYPANMDYLGECDGFSS